MAPDPVNPAIEALKKAINSIPDPRKKQEIIKAINKLIEGLNQQLKRLAEDMGVNPWMDPIPPWILDRKGPPRGPP